MREVGGRREGEREGARRREGVRRREGRREGRKEGGKEGGREEEGVISGSHRMQVTHNFKGLKLFQ